MKTNQMKSEGIFAYLENSGLKTYATKCSGVETVFPQWSDEDV